MHLGIAVSENWDQTKLGHFSPAKLHQRPSLWASRACPYRLQLRLFGFLFWSWTCEQLTLLLVTPSFYSYLETLGKNNGKKLLSLEKNTSHPTLLRFSAGEKHSQTWRESSTKSLTTAVTRAYKQQDDLFKVCSPVGNDLMWLKRDLNK